eukprot:9246_1
MSYDESDEDGEWEVVDIVHTTTSIKPDKKAKPAKKEDVDKLAQQIQSQLSLKSTKDTQQILLLEQKMKQQQKMSEQQLTMIQSKLAAITALQHKQEHQQRDLDKQRRELEAQQKQQLIEQQVQIQSLSEHQILTQKQILEAHQQIQQTQQQTANVNDNIQSLQQLQHQQAMHQQLTEQQIQHQLQPLQEQTQQQLAQIAALTQAQVQANPFATQLPPIPTIQPIPNMNTMNNMMPKRVPPPPPQMQGNNNNNNGWLPSFFVFGNNQKNDTNTHVQDMDISSPPLQGHIASKQDEKDDVLMEEDEHDDDDVLRWANEYGAQQLNPLYDNPQLLKTKSLIGEGKFHPNEKRQCGWVLVNKSSSVLKINAQLECVGGDKQEHGITVKREKEYVFALQPKEEIYILVEVEAPPMVGKYAAFYQLVIDNGVKIGEMLEILCDVRSELSKPKEHKIEQIIKMGFNDRKQVIAMLNKKNWNVQKSVDALIGSV